MAVISKTFVSSLMVSALMFSSASQMAKAQEPQRGFLDAAALEANVSKMNRVGLEIEFSGFSLPEVVETLKEVTQAKVELEVSEFKFVDPATGTEHMIQEEFYRFESPTLGRFTAKREDNGTSLADLQNRYSKAAVVEIVTAPISSYSQVLTFHEVARELKKRGAVGTSAELAVSFQVNVELGNGQPTQKGTEEVLSILRNYLRPENRQLIASELGVPEIRQKYVGLFSDGFMERLLDSNYKPSWQQLFEDSMYRQALERMGDMGAWSLPILKVRDRVMKNVAKNGVESLLPAVKWNSVRLSSLMLFAFPEDWMSKTLIESDWVKPAPILEFREPNNDFETERTVRRILGLVQASEKSGTLTLDARSGRLTQSPLPSAIRSCQAIFLPVAN